MVAFDVTDDDLCVVKREADVVSLLKAAAHPDRLRILNVLLESRMDGHAALTITDVAHRVELSRFSASRHLGVLADAQLVRAVIDGNRRLQELCIESFEAIEDWVIDFTGLLATNESR